MSFLDAREHGSKVGSGGHASAQNEVRALWPRAMRNRRLVSCSSPGVCRVSNGTCASRRAGPVQAIDRRERLRRLALETIDLSKDPYFMRNHLGQYECRLCLTLHNNEGNYLAHHPGAPACIRRPPFLPGGSAALQGISLAHTQARRPVFADRTSCLLAAQHCRASAACAPACQTHVLLVGSAAAQGSSNVAGSDRARRSALHE